MDIVRHVSDTKVFCNLKFRNPSFTLQLVMDVRHPNKEYNGIDFLEISITVATQGAFMFGHVDLSELTPTSLI